MKMIFIIALISLFGFIGYSIASYYTKRKRFFYCLNFFIRKLKTDIGFRANDLKAIIYEFLQTSTSNDLRTILNNFSNSLDSNSLRKEMLFKNITILNEDEKEFVYFFFKRLGRIDVFNQLEELGKFDSRVENCLTLAGEEAKKYCSLYTKLGVIIGAFVALIIL